MFFPDLEGKNGNNTSIIVLCILLQQPITLKDLVSQSMTKQMRLAKMKYFN